MNHPVRFTAIAIAMVAAMQSGCDFETLNLPRQASRVSSDSSAAVRLAVAARSPAPNATGVATDVAVTITFNRAIDLSSVQNPDTRNGTGTILLKDALGRIVAATLTYNPGLHRVTLAPTQRLKTGEQYTVAVRDVLDDADVALAQPVVWTFQTRSTPAALSIIAQTPASGATGVRLDTTITSTFDHAIDPASVWQPASGETLGVFTVRDAGGALVAGQLTLNESSQTLTFAAAEALRPQTTYRVNVRDVRGANGELLRSARNWSFTTAAETALAVTSTTPASGATGVSRNISIAVRFNQSLAPESIINSSTNSPLGVLVVKTAAGANVAGTVTFNPTTSTIMFTPTSYLAPNTSHVVTVKDVRTASGRALSTPVSWAFTTGTAPGQAAQVLSTFPADGASGVMRDTSIRAVFNEPVTGIAAATFVIRDTAANSVLTARSLTFDTNQRAATFRPTVMLSPNTLYSATIQDVSSASGVLTPPYTWSFQTGNLPNTTPAVVSRTPADGATGVARNARLSVVFNRVVTGISAANFTLRHTASNALVTAENVAFASSTLTATWLPAAYLAPNTEYTATLRNILGSDGVSMPEISWSFTTSSSPDNTAPLITAAGLTARANCLDEVTLRWPHATDDTTAQSDLVYSIYSADMTGGYDFSAPLATTPPGQNSHVVTNLDPATTYFFTVRAVDSALNVSASFTERSVVTPSYLACPVLVPVTGGPTALVAGDFDEDGAPDLAVACTTLSRVAILLNDGNGGFLNGASLNLAAGAHPVDVRVADFNHDGHIDLVTANRDNGTISVFLGTGTGSFGGAVATAAAGALAIAPGEFNNPPNTSPDLAVATGNDVIVLTGAGDGTFSASTSLSVATTADAGAVEVGDFDGDGLQDVCVAYAATDQVAAFLNSTSSGGAIGFATPTTAANRLFSAQNAPTAILAPDINLDGFADIAVLNTGTPSVTVRISSGLAGNLFPAGENTALAAGANPVSLAARDLDGDFLPELLTANRALATISILTNVNGNSTFVTETQDAGGRPSGIAIADFNLDGRADAATAAFADNLVAIYLNQR